MVVVVEEREVIKVVNLGGTVLYIFTEPLAQLNPLEMGVYPRLGRYCKRSNLETGRRCIWVTTRGLAVKRGSRGYEEMLSEARDRSERNEAGRRKLLGELKPTHHSNIVNFQNQVIGGS